MNFIPPEKYKYYIGFSISNSTDQFIVNYMNYVGDKSPVLHGYFRGVNILTNGEHRVGDYTFYHFSSIKTGVTFLYFVSFNEFKIINKLLQPTAAATVGTSRSVRIFTLNGNTWVDSGVYTETSMTKLIGYRDQFDRFCTDIDNNRNHKIFLDSIGEGSNSINYLLYGTPGCGKTTFIRSLAIKYGYTILVVRTDYKYANYNVILSPNIQGDVILLFEDFDRYLSMNDVNMSAILNELDGVNKNRIIRIFTANDPEIIRNNEALFSRISSVIKFEKPTIEQYRGKLDILLSFYKERDTKKEEEFLNKIINTEGISLRKFTTHVLRYLFDDNYIQKMMDNPI